MRLTEKRSAYALARRPVTIFLGFHIFKFRERYRFNVSFLTFLLVR